MQQKSCQRSARVKEYVWHVRQNICFESVRRSFVSKVFDSLISHIWFTHLKHNLHLILSLIQTDTCSKTNMHICISPPTHAHVYTQASTHTDLMWHKESNTALSLLHTAWTIYNVLSHWIIDELCFLSTLFLQFCEKLCPFTNNPLRAHSYIIIIDTQSQISTPGQPWDEMFGIWKTGDGTKML